MITISLKNADQDPNVISFGLAGRVCVVTGGAQGIGEAWVRRFARENASVVIADIDDTHGAALAAELGALYVHCDVDDKAQVDALVAQILAAHGRIDVLVNNAGIFKAADFLDISEADFDAVLRVNLKGAFLVGQEVAGMQLLRTSENTDYKYSLAFVGYEGNPAQAEIELTYNWGTAYGHIALGVPDAHVACEKIRVAGGNVTRKAGPVKGGSTVIAFVTDPDGYKIELIERKDNHGTGAGLR